jgi:hypothetical protein
MAGKVNAKGKWGRLGQGLMLEKTKILPKGFMDHTELMVLALQLDDVYQEPILGFASQTVLAGERIALVAPIIVST